MMLERVSVKVVDSSNLSARSLDWEIGPCAEWLSTQRAWVLAAVTDLMGDKTDRDHSREHAFFASCKNRNRREIDKRTATYKVASHVTYIEDCIFYEMNGEQKLFNAKRC